MSVPVLKCRSILIILLLSALACTSARTQQEPGDINRPDRARLRPVVRLGRPLVLENTKREGITWPVWGSAFTAGETVTVRASLEAFSGLAGLVIAGPGNAENRNVVELVRSGEQWTLREKEGNETLQSEPLRAPAAAHFVLSVAPRGATIEVIAANQHRRFTLKRALAPVGGALGIYVHLAPGAKLYLRELALSQPPPTHPKLGTPLRALATRRDIAVGSATDVFPPLHDLWFEALLGAQFDTAGPTEFYWTTSRGEDQDYDFIPADLMVNYATLHNQAITGYFLVWDESLPEWLNQVVDAGGARALEGVLDDHIHTLVSRYKGRVQSWLVVNEAILSPDEAQRPEATFAPNLWFDTLGSGYIERALRTAHAADPAALLLYNETRAEEVGAKSDFMYAMASDFKQRGVPLHGIGLQFHVDAAKPLDMGKVRDNMERFGQLGLSIHITELDVSIKHLVGTEDQKRAVQANVYQDVLQTCLAVRACRSYTVFGFTDNYSWDELGDARPLLFDRAYEPKPAYYAVQRGLR